MNHSFELTTRWGLLEAEPPRSRRGGTAEAGGEDPWSWNGRIWPSHVSNRAVVRRLEPNAMQLGALWLARSCPRGARGQMNHSFELTSRWGLLEAEPPRSRRRGTVDGESGHGSYFGNSKEVVRSRLCEVLRPPLGSRPALQLYRPFEVLFSEHGCWVRRRRLGEVPRCLHAPADYVFNVFDLVTPPKTAEGHHRACSPQFGRKPVDLRDVIPYSQLHQPLDASFSGRGCRCWRRRRWRNSRGSEEDQGVNGGKCGRPLGEVGTAPDDSHRAQAERGGEGCQRTVATTARGHHNRVKSVERDEIRGLCSNLERHYSWHLTLSQFLLSASAIGLALLFVRPANVQEITGPRHRDGRRRLRRKGNTSPMPYQPRRHGRAGQERHRRLGGLGTCGVLLLHLCAHAPAQLSVVRNTSPKHVERPTRMADTEPVPGRTDRGADNSTCKRCGVTDEPARDDRPGVVFRIHELAWGSASMHEGAGRPAGAKRAGLTRDSQQKCAMLDHDHPSGGGALRGNCEHRICQPCTQLTDEDKATACRWNSSYTWIACAVLGHYAGSRSSKTGPVLYSVRWIGSFRTPIRKSRSGNACNSGQCTSESHGKGRLARDCGIFSVHKTLAVECGILLLGAYRNCMGGMRAQFASVELSCGRANAHAHHHRPATAKDRDGKDRVVHDHARSRMKEDANGLGHFPSPPPPCLCRFSRDNRQASPKEVAADQDATTTQEGRKKETATASPLCRQEEKAKHNGRGVSDNVRTTTVDCDITIPTNGDDLMHFTGGGGSSDDGGCADDDGGCCGGRADDLDEEDDGWGLRHDVGCYADDDGSDDGRDGHGGQRCRPAPRPPRTSPPPPERRATEEEHAEARRRGVQDTHEGQVRRHGGPHNKISIEHVTDTTASNGGWNGGYDGGLHLCRQCGRLPPPRLHQHQ